MINYLKNCQKTTLIGQLPDIINSNNQAIRDEFDWIFDSSLNRLKQSVYAPTGSVKAYLGEFVNLSCEYLTIKNVDSLENTIQRAVENIIEDSFNAEALDVSVVAIRNHGLLDNRFSSSTYEECIKTNYAHDAERIFYRRNSDTTYVSVADALSRIEPVVNRFDTTINNAITNVSNYLISVINDTSALLSERIENVSVYANASINDVSTQVNEKIDNVNANLTMDISVLNEIIQAFKNDMHMWILTLNYNDGSTNIKKTTVVNGQPYGPEKLDTPIRPGYTFKGWTDIYNVSYGPETIVNLNNDLDLFANWEQGIILYDSSNPENPEIYL